MPSHPDVDREPRDDPEIRRHVKHRRAARSRRQRHEVDQAGDRGGERADEPADHASRVKHRNAVVIAGIVAGVVSTLVQVALWIVDGAPFPAILFRDARLAAALVMGTSALKAADTFDARVMIVAAVVHFALSIAFATALSPWLARGSTTRAIARGAVFGVALYVLNLHVMTLVFPWFDVSRGAITLAAHVAFGVSAAAA